MPSSTVNGVTYNYTVLTSSSVRIDSVTVPSLMDVVIPSSFGSYIPKETNMSFFTNSNVRSVTVPGTFTYIGPHTFRECANLTSVTILGNLVENVGELAFYFSPKLATITLPNSVSYIGPAAFSRCGLLTSFAIPTSLIYLREGAFSGCTSLTSVVLPESITYYSSGGTFSGCTSLTSINFPNSLTKIPDSFLENCTSLTSIVIPNSVTDIGAYTFKGCNKLPNITLPTSIKSIGSSAFQGCTLLNGVYFASNTTIPTIASDSFSGISASSVAYYNLGVSNPPTTTQGFSSVSTDWSSRITTTVNGSAGTATDPFNNIVYSYTVVTSGTGTASVTGFITPIVNDSAILLAFTLSGIVYIVTSIVDNAFTGWTGSNISIPDSIISIGNNCFKDCTNLPKIDIVHSVLSIGNNAFQGCTGLKNITLSVELTNIGANSFDNCTALTSVVIPSSMTSISAELFKNCSSLTNITLFGTLELIGDSAFYGCVGLTTVTIPASVINIGNNAFNGCTGLKILDIPNTVTSIGSQAFKNCSALTTAYFGTTTTFPSIGSDAFSGASVVAYYNSSVTNAPTTEQGFSSVSTNWASRFSTVVSGSNVTATDLTDGLIYTYTIVTTGTGVASLSSYNDTSSNFKINVYVLNAFTVSNRTYIITHIVNFNSGKSISFSIPNTVTALGPCRQGLLKGVVLPDSVQGLGSETFYGGGRIVSLVVGRGTQYIGPQCFYGGDSLRKITIKEPSSLVQIQSAAFASSKIKTFVMPSKMPEVGGGAFAACAELNTFKFNTIVEYIGDDAFYGCVSLTSIDIPNKIRYLSGFKGCTGLTSIIIPNQVTELGYRAFANCTNLTSCFIPDSVRIIKDEAFVECNKISTFTIPSRVEQIGTYAFNGSTSALTPLKIYFASPTKIPTLNSEAFRPRNGCVAYYNKNVSNPPTTSQGFSSVSTDWSSRITTTVNGSAGTATDSFNNIVYSYTVVPSGTGTATVTGFTTPIINAASILPSFVVSDVTYYVTSIAENALNGWSGVQLSMPYTIVSVGNNAFQDCSNVTGIYLGYEVTNIGTGVFKNCSKLIDIFIPGMVTSISENLFENCSGLKNISITNFITRIGNDAFSGCLGLTHIVIPSNVTSIGNKSYYGCSGLTTVTIPETIAAIGNQAFQNCSALARVYFTTTNTIPTIGSDAFTGISSTATVYYNSVVSTTPTSFQAFPNISTDWLSRLSITTSGTTVTATDLITNIPYIYTIVTSGTGTATIYADYNRVTVGEVEILNAFSIAGKTYIATRVQYPGIGGGNIKTISIPSSITHLDSVAHGTRIYGIQVPSSVTFMQNCFSSCGNLRTATIPASVTQMAAYNANAGMTSFFNCQLLTNVTFKEPKNIVAINDFEFGNCFKLVLPTLIKNFTTNGSSLTIYGGFLRPTTSVKINDSSANSLNSTTINKNGSPLITTTNGNIIITFSASLPALITTISLSDSNGVVYKYRVPPKITAATINADRTLVTITGVWYSNINKIDFLQPDSTTIKTSVYSTDISANVSQLTFNVSDVSTISPRMRLVDIEGTKTDVFFSVNINTVFSTVCFPAGTPIKCDQGLIDIEKINPDIHTVRGKKIVAITQTITPDKHIVCIEKNAFGKNIPSQQTIISKDHKIFYNGKLIKAKEFVGKIDGVTYISYNREILYNVLLEEHDKMVVNNLICETLHPDNGVAKLYRVLPTLSSEEQEELIMELNKRLMARNKKASISM